MITYIPMVVYLLLIVLGFVFRNNKYLFWTMVLFMLLAYGLRTSGADYDVYFNRFNNYNEISSNTEQLFTFVTMIMNKIGFSFKVYLFALTTLSMILPIYIIKKHSANICLTMSLYMLYSLPIDLIQVRSSIGFSFALLGVYLFFIKEKSNILIPIMFIIIGTLFHTGTLLFILFVPAHYLLKRKINYNWIVLIFVAELILSYLVLNTNIIKTQLNGLINLNYLLSHSVVDGYAIPVCMAKSLIAFVICWYLLERQKDNIKNSLLTKETKEKHNKLLYFGEILNVVSLFVIPLYFLGIDLYRIQRSTIIVEITILTIVSIKDMGVDYNNKYSKYIAISLCGFVAVYYMFYIHTLDFITTLLNVLIK